MDVTERIEKHIGDSRIVLFMKGSPDVPQCGFSAQAVAALRACGADFATVNIFEDPELREALTPLAPTAHLVDEIGRREALRPLQDEPHLRGAQRLRRRR